MVNDDQSEVEVSRQALARLGMLVGCDSVAYGRVGLATDSLLSATHEPHVADFNRLPGFNAVFHQHPGFAAYRCGQVALGTPVALTDLADLRTLRRLPLYVDYHQPYGINDQLLCIVHQAASGAPCCPSTVRVVGSLTVTGPS